MSQVINTNVLSLNAQRNLSNNSSALAQSLQRLSSGLRINSAKDDAAGLAISERFSTQIRGLNQAVRNANDGISLAQTGEGSLQEVQSNLQRIRELAVQSVNATNSDSDRAALNQEMQQRLAEIDRIANQTSFNGRKILDGTFDSAVFQVGANVGETIQVDLGTSMRLGDLGAVASATSVDLSTVITEGGALTPTSVSLGAFTDVTLAAVADDGTQTNDFTFSIGGVDILPVTGPTDPDDNTTVTGAQIEAALADSDTVAALAAVGITVTGDATEGFTVTNASDESRAIVSAQGFASAQTEVGAATPAEATPLVLEAGDLSIQIGDGTAVGVVGTFNTNQELLDGVNSALAGNALASINDQNQLVITASETIAITAPEALGFDPTTEVSGDLANTNVLTVASSNDTIQRVDAALSAVSDLRSTFGAIQNRFESTIANLSATSEALSASRSRIRDADFAAETAELTRVQILQQAGISVLAQANAAPQSVLALLQ